MSKNKSKSEERKAERKRHPWRENIEALSMAIVVALVLKVFLLEVSKIPSGSMQPTLMGNPRVGVFDRVIVDKLSFQFRDPQRFEIVVFRHPLERSRNMVKRVVGMPEEWLKIEHGDVWVRPNPEAEWEVLRRSEAVQDDMWRELAVDSGLLSDWKSENAVGWRVDGDAIEARGAGRAEFRPGSSVRNAYFDGYHEALAQKAGPMPPAAGEYPVGDLRLEFEAQVESSCSALRIEFVEGLATYTFELAGPAGSPAAPRVTIEDRSVRFDPETNERLPTADRVVESEEPLALEADEGYELAVENLDDRLRLWVDDELVLEAEVDAIANPTSGLALELVGGGGEFEELWVARDVYYLAGSLPPEGIQIPAEHYFMLGDNTLDSADGREWKQVRLAVEGEQGPIELAGNFRGGNDPLDTNPYPPLAPSQEREVRFRDLWGERHLLAGRLAGELAGHHTVPRQLVQGRAVAIFWPIQPFTGVWRLGWIH